MTTEMAVSKPRRRRASAKPLIKPSQLATAVAELYPPQGEWHESHYFALPETNRIVELSNGDLLISSMPTHVHQRIVLLLAILVEAFVAAHKMGVVNVAPLPVRLRAGKIREPDIFFVTQEHRARIHEQYWEAPDLAVEVISPSTESVDRHEKYYEYAEAGISEYWLVDPEAKSVEVFALDGKAYKLLGKFGLGERAHSKLLNGLVVLVDDVFKD